MMYAVSHYTDSIFTKFDMSRLGENTLGNASSDALAQSALIGVWFTAGGGAMLSQICANCLACTIFSENPYIVDSLEYLGYLIADCDNSGVAFRDSLISQGYDALIVEEDEEFGGRSFCVWDSGKIKIEK